jgi:hypothetical protein
MLVTVEEDNNIAANTSLIKRSQITEKQITAVFTNPNPANVRKTNNNEFDVSLYNHLSHRDLSPTTSEIQTQSPLGMESGLHNRNGNFSLSPSRFP